MAKTYPGGIEIISLEDDGHVQGEELQQQAFDSTGEVTTDVATTSTDQAPAVEDTTSLPANGIIPDVAQPKTAPLRPSQLRKEVTTIQHNFIVTEVEAGTGCCGSKTKAGFNQKNVNACPMDVVKFTWFNRKRW
ncbi:hypothetical protein TrRE_jg5215 [Triparma retinervis]|uniref:Uncharacterized protein n=1 Tax=Triparma retinervis TaxID=2557542 RepID=A0A9W7G469_9STRA|nr:hypothetical protein TrRE_jg5215 [Triparma retinervis]